MVDEARDAGQTFASRATGHDDRVGRNLTARHPTGINSTAAIHLSVITKDRLDAAVGRGLVRPGATRRRLRKAEATGEVVAAQLDASGQSARLANRFELEWLATYVKEHPCRALVHKTGLAGPQPVLNAMACRHTDPRHVEEIRHLVVAH